MTDEELFKAGESHSEVRVRANDYAYNGRVAVVFPKIGSGAVRCVVEDDCGRLFIHNARQIEAR